MGTMASEITSLTIVHSAVYSGTDLRKHQSSVSLAFVRGIHWWPVNSPHKGPVTRKKFPFDDVFMCFCPEVFKQHFLKKIIQELFKSSIKHDYLIWFNRKFINLNLIFTSFINKLSILLTIFVLFYTICQTNNGHDYHAKKYTSLLSLQ